MDLLLVKALLYIAKYCVIQQNCKECKIRAFCGKQPAEW